ncbi:MAG: hypothetical protein HC772_07300 [Leptolyngbyaceae cyanobacterium CRU_2_3]|nr:hypothetical protein [Leptolyngbyaceae cyanobacterium CRU_2_3]
MTRTLTKNAVSPCVKTLQVEIPAIQAFVNHTIEHFQQIEDLRLRKAFLTVFSDKVKEYVLKDLEHANVSSSEEIKGWYTRVRDVTELRSELQSSHKEIWEAVANSLDSMIAHLLWSRSEEISPRNWQFL